MKKSKFWAKGIRFECQGSGNCCVSHGGYGHVFLTKTDRKTMAKHLGMATAAFTQKYCTQQDGVWKIDDGEGQDCAFLKDKRCSIYAARPTQCRTWPFWPEVLNARTWSKEVTTSCPGVGRGRVWTAAEIEVQLQRQLDSEKDYGT